MSGVFCPGTADGQYIQLSHCGDGLVLGRKGGAVFKEVLVAKIARGNTPEATCGELASEFDLNRRGRIS